MKKILFLLCILCSCKAFSQIDDETFHRNINADTIIKKNKIATEDIYSFRFNKKGIKDSTLIEIRHYDAMGNIIKDTFTTAKYEDRSTIYYTNTYTSFGKLSKQIIDNRNTRIYSNIIYEYNNNKNEIFKYDFNKDTTYLKVLKKVYDGQNNKTELWIRTNDNPFYLSRKYYYDSAARLSKVEAFNAEKESIYAYYFDYVDSLNAQIVYFGSRERERKAGEYLYNEYGLCIKAEDFFQYSTSIIYRNSSRETDKEETQTTYNTDQTIFEVHTENDVRKRFYRHYYTKFQ